MADFESDPVTYAADDQYVAKTWRNYPDLSTPLTAEELTRIDEGVEKALRPSNQPSTEQPSYGVRLALKDDWEVPPNAATPIPWNLEYYDNTLKGGTMHEDGSVAKVPLDMDGRPFKGFLTVRLSGDPGAGARVYLTVDGALWGDMDGYYPGGAPGEVTFSARQEGALLDVNKVQAWIKRTSTGPLFIKKYQTRFNLMMDGYLEGGGGDNGGGGEEEAIWIEGPDVQANYCLNPEGFQVGNSSVQSGWWNSGGNLSSGAISTLDGWAYALSFVPTAALDQVIYTPPTYPKPGERVNVLAFVKIPAGAVYSFSVIGEEDEGTPDTETITGTGVWVLAGQTISAVDVAEDGVTAPLVHLVYLSGSKAEVRYTGLTITGGLQPDQPFSGNSPDDPLTAYGHSYAWEGTPRASRSLATEYILDDGNGNGGGGGGGGGGTQKPITHQLGDVVIRNIIANPNGVVGKSLRASGSSSVTVSGVTVTDHPLAIGSAFRYVKTGTGKGSTITWTPGSGMGSYADFDGVTLYGSAWALIPVGIEFEILGAWTNAKVTKVKGTGGWQVIKAELGVHKSTDSAPIKLQFRQVAGVPVTAYFNLVTISRSSKEPFAGTIEDDPLTGSGYAYDFQGEENNSFSLRTTYETIKVDNGGGGGGGGSEDYPETLPGTFLSARFHELGQKAYWTDGEENNDCMGTDRIDVSGDDPIGVRPGKVAKYHVRAEDKHPTTGSSSYPRGQLVSEPFAKEGKEFWVGLAHLYPEEMLAIRDKVVKNETVDMLVMMHEMFGPPHSKGPNRLVFRNGQVMLSAGNVTGGQPDRGTAAGASWAFTPVPMKWYDYALHYYMSEDPAKGFVALWINDGTGWKNVPLYQGKTVQTENGPESRRYYKTLGPKNNGTNKSYIKVSFEGTKGLLDEVIMYVGDHRIGPSRAHVDPHTYG